MSITRETIIRHDALDDVRVSVDDQGGVWLHDESTNSIVEIANTSGGPTTYVETIDSFIDLLKAAKAAIVEGAR